MQAFERWGLPRPEPDFGRLEKALHCQIPDRVPLVELDVAPEIMAQFLGRPVTSRRDVVDFYLQAGYDFVPIVIYGRGYFGLDNRGLAVANRKRMVTGKMVIDSWADWRQYEWPSIELIYADVSAKVQQTAANLPDGMRIILNPQVMSEIAYVLMGFERLAIASVEEPDLVQAIIDKSAQSIITILERLLDFDKVGALWVADDIAFSSNLLLSPCFYRTYVFPWYRKVCAMAQQRGLPIIYHSDGNYLQVMEDLIACGINAIQPVEAGSMDIMAVKQQYAGRLCIIGNIDLNTLGDGKPEDVRAEVLSKLRRLMPGGGYCVSSSNTIPDYVKIDNYVAMIRTVLEHGCYQ